MRIKTLFLVSLLIAPGAVPAEQSGLENTTKQLLKDTAKSAAPNEVTQGTKAAEESLEKAKNLKESVEKAPAALKEQAQEAAKQAAERKLKEAVPEEAKQGVKAVEEGVGKAKKLKGQVENAPKSTSKAAKAIKNKAKQDATNKALDLPR